MPIEADFFVSLKLLIDTMDSFSKQFANRTGKDVHIHQVFFPMSQISPHSGHFLCNLWPCTLPVVVGENRVLKVPGIFIVAGRSLIGNFWAYLGSTHVTQYIPAHQQQGISRENSRKFSVFFFHFLPCVRVSYLLIYIGKQS